MHPLFSQKTWIVALLLALSASILTYKLKTLSSNKDLLSEPIKKGSVLDSVYGIGMVTATHSFSFKSGISCTVEKILVQEGDTIKKGQALLELAGVGKVRAPFAGTVTNIPVNVGESVFAQSILINVVDLQDRYLTVTLEQRGALRVRAGQSARISFDSMRDQPFMGQVQAIYSNNNNFLVRIKIGTLAPQILPGMSGDVAISIREKKEVLLIPISAVDKGKVSVVRGISAPRTVDIVTGIIDGAMAEIASGDLQEGDRVVIRMKGTP